MPTEMIPHPAGPPDVTPEDRDEARRRASDPRMIPWVGLQALRERGLLEGDAFDEAWKPMVRDPELGKLLLDRYGVVIGSDGDRLYMRRADAKDRS